MIYLDNAATTRLCPEARAMWLRFSEQDFGNASSAHRMGIAAERGLKDARATLARALGCEPAEIVWTSGGTEADALALLGAARASRGRHVITSAIEHPAVLGSVEQLVAAGFRKTTIPVSPGGLVDPTRVADAICDDTALCSIMHVNNEIGTVQPIEEIVRAVKTRNSHTLVHVDAVQSFGKIPLNLQLLGADLVSVSAHKLHGPKGVGALYVRRGVRLQPLWAGGGQQGGMRSGTENVAGAAAAAAASEAAIRELPEAGPRMARLRDRLVTAVCAALPQSRLVGDDIRRAPHNANLGFPGVRAEALLHALEERGVTVSAGAACSSRDKRPSHVLRAIGLPEDIGTIRVTLSRETTEEEIGIAEQAIVDAVRSLVP